MRRTAFAKDVVLPALILAAAAQECCQAWDRPYLCRPEGTVSRPGQRGECRAVVCVPGNL